MKSTRFLVVVVFIAALAGPTAAVHADGTLGVFCWEQQPFPDVVCFDVEPRGPFFALTGDDTVSGVFSGLVDGTAMAVGSEIHLEFTQTFPGFVPTDPSITFENFATINSGTLSGTWADEFGGGNLFTFLGTAPGTYSAESRVQGRLKRKDSRR